MSRPALSVVVVDDSQTMRRAVTSYLSRDTRLSVIAAHPDVAAALEAVVAVCPDVIVLDNQMPGCDGLDGLPHLRAACPYARIVMFSADGQATAALALDRGADAFVSKDSELADLVAAVIGR